MPHEASLAAPPKTEVKEVKETLHGVEVVDPYRWLEDQDSLETRAWINSENAYTDSLLEKLPGRDDVKNVVSGLLKVDFTSQPQARNGRYFFTHRSADQDQAALFMRQGAGGKDELLVDPLALSPEHAITVNLNFVSRDGSMIAYGLRKGGEDEVVLHLYDVNARKDLPDQFPRARYSGIAILPDKTGAYYTKQTKDGPRVFFHKIGASVEQDSEIFGKGYGPENLIGARLSEDGHYVTIVVSHGSAAEQEEIYCKDLKANGPITTIVNDLKATFSPVVAGDRIFLETNWKAPKGRLVEIDLQHPGHDHWREVLAESDAVLEGVNAVGGRLVVDTHKNVVTTLTVRDLNGKAIREITPPTMGSLGNVSGTFGSTEGFYSFSSFSTPQTIFRYDVATGKQSIWFQPKVPLQPDQFEVKQVWYSSKDGTKVPMFVAHKKGMKLDGNNPTLLTGYGGFNLSSNPGFNGFAAAWLARGGVYALANMRGGGEFGEEWHHAGMKEKKQNVFDDFIAAAEWLIANKYTSPQKLAIRGTSNGGLLMGAMITQRPDLFGAVICGYPLLDMVRYQKFLVARYWVPEYGSSDDPEQFKYIYAYSPYHHIKAGTKYPAVLFISGDSDTRVAPLHARKMTALMQASQGGDKPILLHYDTKAGHSGGTPVSKQIENSTDEIMFLLWQLRTLQPVQTASGQK
ncbi:MAG TPA: prolyl oligopeptidase family serine peptidase [Candidatus Limnocylindrales bacterium]|nr:prolyl oligopeptidase family serine peptidase [Candidatus Limnocylindrales bacterium]